MARLMALDVGAKRIGVAITDSLQLTAQGLQVLANTPTVLADIADLCREYAVEKIVVGLPKNMNNTIGPQGEMALEFGQRVGEATGLPVAMEDERLTTVVAEQTLIAANSSRRKRRRVVDKLAATLILQSYLARSQKNE